MTKNDARESRRSILAALGVALKTIGDSGLRGSGAMEAFAACHRCLGRLQAVDEMEAYEEACECGRRVQFPPPMSQAETMASLTPEQRAAVERSCLTVRPVIETIDPDAQNPGSIFVGGPDPYAGVEIDPLLTPSQVEAAWHAAREQDLAQAAEVAEDSDESLDSVCAALDRAAVECAINGTVDGPVEIAPGVHARRSESGSISLSGDSEAIRAYLRTAPTGMSASSLVEGAYHRAVVANGGAR